MAQRKTTPAIFLCGGDDRCFPDDSDCPSNDQHTHMPRGYVDRAEWAARMAKTHRQKRCPDCGRLAIWEPRR